MSSAYDDIIHLPHPVSKRHARMSMINRAAQFSPFAALTGYDSAIEETGRQTDDRIYLDEQEMNALDRKHQLLQRNIALQPDVCITYFIADERKDGGRYAQVTGLLKKIDPIQRIFILTDGTAIPIDDIRDLQSDLFSQLNTP